ncbi:PhoD-like phosphatase, partial [Yasminevirus sp. GU-2018]
LFEGDTPPCVGSFYKRCLPAIMNCTTDFILPVLGEHINDRIVLILIVKATHSQLKNLVRSCSNKNVEPSLRVRLFTKDDKNQIYDQTQCIDTDTKRYRFELTGVKPNTQFTYCVSTNFFEDEVSHSFNMRTNKRCLFVACDNNEAGFGSEGWSILKERADYFKVSKLIHLGDQVYLDTIFSGMTISLSRCCEDNDDMTAFKSHVKDQFYEVYVRSFSDPAKAELLATRSNIMIGDDHEISDDNNIVSTFWARNECCDFVKCIAMEVFKEIQVSLRLRLDEEKDLDLYHTVDGKTLTIFMGRTVVSTIDQNKYVTYIKETVNKYDDEVNRIILCPTVPWFFSTSSWFFIRYFFGDYDGSMFRTVYKLLKELSRCGKKIRIVSGDVHSFIKINVKTEDGVVIPMDVTGCVRGCLNFYMYFFVSVVLPFVKFFTGSLVKWRDAYGGLYYDGVKDSVVHVSQLSILPMLFNEILYIVFNYFKRMTGDLLTRRVIRDHHRSHNSQKE